MADRAGISPFAAAQNRSRHNAVARTIPGSACPAPRHGETRGRRRPVRRHDAAAPGIIAAARPRGCLMATAQSATLQPCVHDGIPARETWLDCVSADGGRLRLVMAATSCISRRATRPGSCRATDRRCDFRPTTPPRDGPANPAPSISKRDRALRCPPQAPACRGRRARTRTAGSLAPASSVALRNVAARPTGPTAAGAAPAAVIGGGGRSNDKPAAIRCACNGSRPWMVPRSLAASARARNAACSSRKAWLFAMPRASRRACASWNAWIALRRQWAVY